MTIRYIANLTFEEQITHWENGNSEEAKLGAWLRAKLLEIEDQQIQDIGAITEQEREAAYDKGYDKGYVSGLSER
jgi:hypothetical protein